MVGCEKRASLGDEAQICRWKTCARCQFMFVQLKGHVIKWSSPEADNSEMSKDRGTKSGRVPPSPLFFLPLRLLHSLSVNEAQSSQEHKLWDLSSYRGLGSSARLNALHATLWYSSLSVSQTVRPSICILPWLCPHWFVYVVHALFSLSVLQLLLLRITVDCQEPIIRSNFILCLYGSSWVFLPPPHITKIYPQVKPSVCGGWGWGGGGGLPHANDA